MAEYYAENAFISWVFFLYMDKIHLLKDKLQQNFVHKDNFLPYRKIKHDHWNELLQWYILISNI